MKNEKAKTMTFLARIISTGLGIGYFPKVPGTAGSLATVIVFWFCPDLLTLPFIFLCVFIILVGIITSSITEKEFQQKSGDNTLHDPSIIIIDEIAGMLVALIALPKTLPFVIAAFLLFRFFDIVKPFPVNKAEKLPAGWGIMLDDVVAGILANVILQLGRLILN
ncbi:phosphatidylglycerophosphatase A [candidate division KSB1 bacterium]|nr:phosphatidylglycerophosphatase A [candidate division KSB1 bacterium]MBL7095389.1 phosphatidylglycerophosphatase A [candidate division KSB1 bacterium]